MWVSRAYLYIIEKQIDIIIMDKNYSYIIEIVSFVINRITYTLIGIWLRKENAIEL